MVNVTGPRVTTAASGAQQYGAWGRDPQPEVGKESWYWLVMLTSSNVYANYVRRFTSLSALIVGASRPGKATLFFIKRAIIVFRGLTLQADRKMMYSMSSLGSIGYCRELIERAL